MSRTSAAPGASGVRVLCRHCGVRHANRRRGLCSVCYYDHEIVKLYPLRSDSHRSRDAPKKRCSRCRNRRGGVDGLCSACRAQTSPGHCSQVDAEMDFFGPGRVPEPTTALPGSPEKVRVLEERAARREQLHHPLDGADGCTEGAPAGLAKVLELLAG